MKNRAILALTGAISTMLFSRILIASSILYFIEKLGLVYVEGIVRGPTGKEENVQFLVDSGATYTLLPKEVWMKLELKPFREHVFILADGTRIARKVSECYIILSQGEGHTPVILGEEGDQAILGIVTLEIFGLILDPFKREIKPMRMMLI